MKGCLFTILLIAGGWYIFSQLDIEISWGVVAAFVAGIVVVLFIVLKLLGLVGRIVDVLLDYFFG